MIVSMRFSILAILLLLVLTACGQAPTQPEATKTDRLNVVATTTILGDVVHNVGGQVIELTILLPLGADPHSFQPTPQDATRLADADLVFMNGLGLEAFMTSLLQNAGGQAKLVSVSEGITSLAAPQDEAHQAGDGANGHEQSGDPHVWMDPNNVIMWVDNIERALSEMDPGNAGTYRANAAAYRQELAELDRWLNEQVAQVPQANREMVTDHQVFGYFAARYGFKQIGAIIPGYSTLSEPSAQELAALETAIRDLGVQAIFVGNTVNPSLAKRVAEDTGVQIVALYTGSLTPQGEPASTYLDYMRYNASAIVGALK